MNYYNLQLILPCTFYAFSGILCDIINDDEDFYKEQAIDLFEILYGDEAKRNQFPHHVSLQQKLDDKYRHICSGVIINNKWVVTTAYCVYRAKSHLRIVAGSLVLDEIHKDIQTTDVISVIVHPNFTGEISENDIALLKLRRNLVYTKAVLPLKLLPSDTEYVRGSAVISGWNVHNQTSPERISFKNLFYIIVDIEDSAACAQILEHLHISPGKVVCSEATDKQLYCPGESGSPLIFDGRLLGLTSWGISPCDMTAYTKVSSYMDFLLKYIYS